MRRLKRWWWLLLLIPLLAVGAFVAWASRASPPIPEALAALQSDQDVKVSTERWLTFQPTAYEPAAGLILYPGARVDPRAYAPPARAIAAEGYLVVIVPMPLNLAFLAPDAAQAVIEAFPQVDRWAVGGHSLGGAMAARFAHRSPHAVQGLSLWASYPAASDDLSAAATQVTSVYGTLDGLATMQEVETSRPQLPTDTEWVAIEGGNHAQFGWYGPQSGDNPAAITRQEQQARTVDATVRLLERLGE